jgi:hypothetical protein
MRILWEPPNSAEDGSLGTPIYLLAFFAAAALKEDRTLLDPPGLVTLIARLKYAARSFCMIEALEMRGRSTMLE